MKGLLLVTALCVAAPIVLAQKAEGQVHKGSGVVTSVDRAFGVKDKAMLDKLAKDRKVEFEFVQQGRQYVITSIQ
jgi:hypothetical protein